MNIKTSDAKPFKERQYFMSPFMLKILNIQLDDILKLGEVEPSISSLILNLSRAARYITSIDLRKVF